MAPPPASLEAWEGLATQACLQLLEVCTSHPNQKKVYTAVITRHLLLLLSQAIWPPSHRPPEVIPQSCNPPSAASKSDVAPARRSGLQLMAAAQHLLRAVVFHSNSVDGVVQLGACFSSSNEPGSAATGNAAEVSAPRSYHLQLLQVDCAHPPGFDELVKHPFCYMNLFKSVFLLPCLAGLPICTCQVLHAAFWSHATIAMYWCMTFLNVSLGTTTT